MNLNKSSTLRAGGWANSLRKTCRRASFVAGASVAIFAGHAQAATDTDPQLLDFNLGGGTYSQTLVDYTGPAVVGSAGDVFNNFEATQKNTVLPVVDTLGNATNVTMSFQSDGAYITNLNSDGFVNTTYANLMTSYVTTYGETTPDTVALTGLNPGEYNLFILSENNQPSETSFTVQGNLSDVETADNPHDLAYTDNNGNAQTTGGSPSTFVEGVNYVEFDNVVVNSSGDLTFTWVSDTGTSAILNGFQLETAPEPSTWALMLAGAALLVGWSRRHALR